MLLGQVKVCQFDIISGNRNNRNAFHSSTLLQMTVQHIYRRIQNITYIYAYYTCILYYIYIYAFATAKFAVGLVWQWSHPNGLREAISAYYPMFTTVLRVGNKLIFEMTAVSLATPLSDRFRPQTLSADSRYFSSPLRQRHLIQTAA